VAGRRQSWDGEADRLNPLRFLLLLGFVGGIVVLIWWAYAAGHIKHVGGCAPADHGRRRRLPRPYRNKGPNRFEFDSKDRSAGGRGGAYLGANANHPQGLS